MTQAEQWMTERIARVRDAMESAAREAGRAPGSVLLCAASKTQNVETVRLAAGMDIDIFGENRVQELVQKHEAGAYGEKPLHFIGHLQTNKVKQVVGRAVLIQSVGSLHLLQAVEAQAQKQGLQQDVLLEVNIAGEDSKSGVAPEELPALLEEAAGMQAVRVRGLMAIPPVPQCPGDSRRWFARMYDLFAAQSRQGERVRMEWLSMGMSADYADAIREGANIVRVGTAIFGERSYPVR